MTLLRLTLPACLALFAAFGTVAPAQDAYPSRTVTIVNPFAPGGGTDLLARMLTARVHLDDMTDENGPLRVVPGSHRFDRTADDEPRPPVVVRCRAGDVLLMRPLLTHASSHADAATRMHRRIVHLECAPAGEPGDGYEWREFLPLR